MGESACLERSFSNPADISHEAKEGHPIRAFTESVSFGRFMSESLAWEKWSTFSHNRYLEEVEKSSKPGSVAQKKAFFEAHYKRRAAMRAAALLEQANTIINCASQMGTINAASVDSSLNADSANANNSLAMNQREKDISNAEVANTADIDADNLNVEREKIDIIDVERGQSVMEQGVNMENTQVENSKALENVDNHGMIMATPDKKIPRKQECTDHKNLTSSSKKRRTNYLSKSSTPSRASKLPVHPPKQAASAQAKSDAGAAKSTLNSNDKKKTIPNSLHMSINFASAASKTSKTSLRVPKDSSNPLETPPTRALKKAAGRENLALPSEKRQSNSTSKLSNHGGVFKQATSRIGNNHALIDEKSAVDSNKQRSIVQKSLHVSTNFTPRAGETNKTSLKISRESSTSLQTPSKASVNGASMHASKVLQSLEKGTIVVLNKSVSGGVAGDGRWPSLSICSNSSIARGTSTRSPISSSPFSFRREEKAAKRKEIPSTWPQSPKFGRKPSPNTVQDANSRPPRRPSNNTESSKHVFIKNNRITCSVTSLPKNMHENASPNILSVGKGSISYKREHGGSVAGGSSL